jgi:hypothetical protein
MNIRTLLTLLPLIIVSGCASSTADAPDNTEEDLKKTAAGVSLSARDNGATFAVEMGKKVVVKLAFGGNSPSALSQWVVTSTSRSLGQPVITVKNSPATDAPATQTLQWKIGGFTQPGDVNKVTLTSTLPSGAKKTFSFTAKVIAARPTAARVGEVCGGTAGVACAADLDCVIRTTRPDGSGICRKTPTGSDVGEICGGIAGFLCKDGLSCKLAGTFPDAAGECVNPGATPGTGTTCGTVVAFRCSEGFACVSAGNVPDADGRCIAQSASSAAGVGETCGGLAAIACQAGLDCNLVAGSQDASGECVTR